jgi:hypothetical protein
MEMILQTVEERLIDLVPEVDMACWHEHLNMVELLHK